MIKELEETLELQECLEKTARQGNLASQDLKVIQA